MAGTVPAPRTLAQQKRHKSELQLAQQHPPVCAHDKAHDTGGTRTVLEVHLEQRLQLQRVVETDAGDVCSHVRAQPPHNGTEPAWT